jgi:pyruvate,water dikinase
MTVAVAADGAPVTGNAYIIPFELAGDEPVTRIGGKCIGLAALVRAKAPVSPGFVVTTDAYEAMLQVEGLGHEIARQIEELDVNNFENEARVSGAILEAFVSRPMPPGLEAAIRAAYARLSSQAHGEAAVAVRSSGTGEDLPDASFAGQGDTYLGVVGADEVVAKVKRCWASLYSARAMSYRAQRGVGHLDVEMAVAVQVMVDARSAGVAMTLDPANGDRSKIVIESTWGLGETLVSGEVTPDHFLVDKVMMIVVNRRISEKEHELALDSVTRHAVHRQVPEARRHEPSISDEELKRIAQAAKTIERNFGCPQDIEWAIDEKRVESGGVVILQSRPETVWSKKKPPASKTAASALGVGGVLGTLIAPIAAKGDN